jgi:hypothetical protein
MFIQECLRSDTKSQRKKNSDHLVRIGINHIAWLLDGLLIFQYGYEAIIWAASVSVVDGVTPLRRIISDRILLIKFGVGVGSHVWLWFLGAFDVYFDVGGNGR